jgi:hypothetical protein
LDDHPGADRSLFRANNAFRARRAPSYEWLARVALVLRTATTVAPEISGDLWRNGCWWRENLFL